MHVIPGWFIPSESELMSLKSKENAHELMERCLPGNEDKKTGNVRFLSPTARTKIAANLAMKVMGECVAIDATVEKSFDKDDYMANLIEQAKWLKAGEGVNISVTGNISVFVNIERISRPSID